MSYADARTSRPTNRARLTAVSGPAGTPGARVPATRTVGPRPDAVDRLRRLAGQGLLAAAFGAAGAAERAALTSAAYALIWPVMFDRLTRVIELRRGHFACAVGVHRLADECLDGFHDDVEAAVTHLLHGAIHPIANVEGWVSSRLVASTVDGFRRRRGERGALQRPRAPRWLCRALGDDQWLIELSVQILNWVGCPGTAGSGLWPLDSWALRRAATTGDWAGSDSRVVQREIDHVLAVMRTRITWYADYVERPLGHKQPPPPAVRVSDEDGQATELTPLAAVDQAELDDAHLLDLANGALIRLRGRLERGESAAAAIPEVLREAFRDGPDHGGMDRPPYVGDAHYDEYVADLLNDPAATARLVDAVLAVLRATEPPHAGQTAPAGVRPLGSPSNRPGHHHRPLRVAS